MVKKVTASDNDGVFKHIPELIYIPHLSRRYSPDYFNDIGSGIHLIQVRISLHFGLCNSRLVDIALGYPIIIRSWMAKDIEGVISKWL